MWHILDETSRLGVEELVVGLRSVCSAGGSEACDVVVGGGSLAVGHSSRSHCGCGCGCGRVRGLQSVGGSVSGGAICGQRSGERLRF